MKIVSLLFCPWFFLILFTNGEGIYGTENGVKTVWSCVTKKNGKMDCMFKKSKLTASYGFGSNSEEKYFAEEQDETCPADQPKKDLYRLSNTRFYVIHTKAASGVHYLTGKENCKALGLRLAQIPDLPTNTLVSRALEQFTAKRQDLAPTLYWLDLVYNTEFENYFWENDTSKPVNFHNIFFLPSRPKGLGSFVTKPGGYLEPTERQRFCIAIGINHRRSNNKSEYGLATAWWERWCNEVIKTAILCESTDPSCELIQPLSVFTRANTDYYTGFWPMSNRRFVVSWLPRSFSEASAYCKSNKMQLYVPHPDDEKCLSPGLKQWMPSLTVHSFWTDLKYNFSNNSRSHFYQNGTLYANTKDKDNPHSNLTRPRPSGRSELTQKKSICSSLSWVSEFPEDNKEFCNCKFHALELSGENCNDRIGVICQHEDHDNRECVDNKLEKLPNIWTSSDPNEADPAKYPQFSEFFGFDGKEEYMRSAYKQKGLQATCLEGYRLATEDDDYWGTVKDYKSTQYPYDFDTSYWLQPAITTTFTICYESTVIYDQTKDELRRQVTEYEDCDKKEKWNFFICRKIPPTEATTTMKPATEEPAEATTTEKPTVVIPTGEPTTKKPVKRKRTTKKPVKPKPTKKRTKRKTTSKPDTSKECTIDIFGVEICIDVGITIG